MAEAARSTIGSVRLYFVVDTLEYLHRGGRIGTATKLVGSVLNLKPILAIEDGVAELAATVRTRRKALDKVYELLQEQLGASDEVHMAVFNVAAPEEAVHFKEQLEARFHPVEMIETECSPVLGAHAGPGTVGVACKIGDISKRGHDI